MNDLKVFKNSEFGELGIMLINGKEYFPATQCAKILGYTNPRDAIQKRCKEDGVAKRDVIDSLGRTQHMNFINEGNLYRLIVSSKLPSAEKFERWVFDEVLPQIRRNGSYGSINIEEIITKTATAVVSEVLKHIVPLIVEKTPPKEVIPKYKKARRATGIIAKLDNELQKTVDEMLLSEKFTFKEICQFLSEYGISLSITSVWRYNKKLHCPVINEKESNL
ncbi:MAG: BRO family protein [Ruminococcus sp.]|nr:BRO family protein [Ruminococcus sp.]